MENKSVNENKPTYDELLDMLYAWAEWHYQQFGDTSVKGPIAENSALLARAGRSV